jgi:hypothetical protein
MSRPAVRRAVLAALLFSSFTGQSPARAHHTFVTKYDGSKVVTISGVVSSVSFSNPHIRFEVQGSGGSWTVETESVSAAKGRGLTQSALKEGAKVTVTGWRARDGSAQIGLKSISITGGPSVTMRSTAR